jgi:Flp pilus assembly protein TadG
MRTLLKRLREEERGSVLVIVAVLLVAMIGLAAFSIDIGSWFQTERQAQSAADAAALAGAADLPANASTAVTDAETYAAKNTSGWNLSSTTSCTAGTQQICVTTPYNGNSSEIRVSVTKSDPSFFGKLLGITSATITKTAAASAGSVTVPGPVFAGSTSCSAISFTGLNGGSLGGLVTNGSISFGGSNSGSISSVDYNSSCSSPQSTEEPHSTITIGSTTTNNGTLPYPVEYRQQSQTINCTGSGGTVTESGQANPVDDTTSNDNYTYSNTGSYTPSGTLSGVYCASTIVLNNSAALSGNATFIANTIEGGVSDTGTLTPALGSLLMWETGTSQIQINSPTFLNGGVVFAPYAQLYLNSNALSGGAQTTFLEGNTVAFTSDNSGSLSAPGSIVQPNGGAELVQ